MTSAIVSSVFVFGCLGYSFGTRKRRPVLGTVLGVCLGLAGVIILLCMTAKPAGPGSWRR
jgi:hypothetical protein